jgi:hypothetical protein
VNEINASPHDDTHDDENEQLPEENDDGANDY